MSANRSFRPSSKINNELWQKNSGNNVLVELIPSEANSVFISQDLTVGNTITVTSSEKLKDDIIELKNDDDILKLNPKKYTYKNDENKKIHFGLIAEEVETIYPNLVTTNTSEIKSINYLEIVPLLLSKIKDLQNQIDELKK
jgi:hypothetical protein